MTFTAMEAPLHRPRPCPTCGTSSTAIFEDRCLGCSSDGASPPARPVTNLCGCGQRLLLNRPGRTRCERCRLDAQAPP